MAARWLPSGPASRPPCRVERVGASPEWPPNRRARRRRNSPRHPRGSPPEIRIGLDGTRLRFRGCESRRASCRVAASISRAGIGTTEHAPTCTSISTRRPPSSGRSPSPGDQPTSSTWRSTSFGATSVTRLARCVARSIGRAAGLQSVGEVLEEASALSRPTVTTSSVVADVSSRGERHVRAGKTDVEDLDGDVVPKRRGRRSRRPSGAGPPSRRSRGASRGPDRSPGRRSASRLRSRPPLVR